MPIPEEKREPVSDVAVMVDSLSAHPNRPIREGDIQFLARVISASRPGSRSENTSRMG